MNKWTFSVIDNWNDIWSESNVAHWTKVMGSAQEAHVFYHPALVKAWVETYMPLRHLTPIFLWTKNETGNEGFFPLVLWRKNWKNAFMRSIVPMGYSDFDYHDHIFVHPIDDPTAFWHRLIDFLKCQYRFDEICIDGISEKMLGDATSKDPQ